MQSVFSRLSPDDVRTDPFPHIIAEDVLPPDLYARLSETFPPFSAMAWDGPEPDNRRYSLSAHRVPDHGGISSEWREFAALHSSSAILAEVDALLGRHWSPEMLRRLGGGVLGHEHGLYWRDPPAP